MRVCLLGNDYTQQFPLVGYGGIEACVENLAYGLSKYKDIDLTVVIPKRQVINNYDATPFKLVETEAIPTALSGHSPNTFCLQAKKIIKDIKPDIIWSQSNWSADILQDLNIPIICTFHDSCPKQTNWIKKSANIRYRFLSLFQYHNWIKESWEKEISFQCYSGLVDQEYQYVESASEEEYFLWCAGLQWGWEAKGLNLFIDLAKHNPDKKFIAYGAGNTSIELSLSKLTIPNFIFGGCLDRGEEHRKVFGQASALIMPTQIPDTFPRTCLESISKGTPIIASNKGSLPEVINLTGAGIVCDQFDDYNAAIQNIHRFNTQSVFESSKQFSIYQEIDTLLSYSANFLL